MGRKGEPEGEGVEEGEHGEGVELVEHGRGGVLGGVDLVVCHLFIGLVHATNH